MTLCLEPDLIQVYSKRDLLFAATPLRYEIWNNACTNCVSCYKVRVRESDRKSWNPNQDSVPSAWYWNSTLHHHPVYVTCREEAPHRSGCQCDDDASEKGEVVAWVRSMPHRWQQESGSCGVVRTALVTHPAQEIQQASHSTLYIWTEVLLKAFIVE